MPDQHTNCFTQEWDIFIAHASTDAGTATTLYDLLEPHCKPFLDRRSLLLGDDWDIALSSAQKHSLITVVLISSSTEKAYYQREEIAASIALGREDASRHRVVPIYLDSHAETDSVPYGLRLKHGLCLSDTIDIKNASEQLIDLLSRLQKLTVSSSSSRPPATQNRDNSDSSLNYYVYISPTKVDMLFDQIPIHTRNAIANKREIEVVMLQLGGTPIHSKTKIVIDYLEDSGQIGTIDEPKAYFRGRLPMRWGPYANDGLLYFGAETENTVVGLGGSDKNVIGNTGASHAHSHSATPTLVRALKKELGIDEGTREYDNCLALTAVELATTQMRGTQQTINFVARKLIWSHDSGIHYVGSRQHSKRVLLGSPVYAALVDG